MGYFQLCLCTFCKAERTHTKPKKWFIPAPLINSHVFNSHISNQWRTWVELKIGQINLLINLTQIFWPGAEAQAAAAQLHEGRERREVILWQRWRRRGDEQRRRFPRLHMNILNPGINIWLGLTRTTQISVLSFRSITLGTWNCIHSFFNKNVGA